ncbi:MAG TPA: penicillin-binding protein 2 [Thermomicrobiaceae bacterium]|nr:penicillin-binding protein 2 [Thermomicrobiaceae bacterium]
MRLYLRAVALLSTLLIIGYGLVATPRFSSATMEWLAILGISFVLLLVALWPRLPNWMPRTQRSLVRTMIVFFVTFILITVQLVRVQVVDSAAIGARTGRHAGEVTVQDPRLRSAASEVLRGAILTSDGKVVARTTQLPDGSLLRSYPDPTTAYLAGYYSPRLYGSNNLEAAYDDVLMGRKGGNPVTQWLDGLLHRTKKGYNLTLTVDDDLQKKADALLGDRQGAVVLLDAKTGAVRAFVSKPNFDPNKLYVNEGPELDQQVNAATAYWQQLNGATGSPLLLKPTQGLFIPGSIFKTVTASAALETGTAKPDTVYRDEGQLAVESRVIPEENRPDPNRIDYSLSDAYAYSLNVVFAQVGLQLGPENLAEYAHRFGFGQTIPFTLPVVPSQLASDPNFLSSPAALAVTAFGQGQLQVTPLQMALVAEAVANNGEMMTPYLVEKTSTQDGKTLDERDPTAWQRAITAETAATMRQIMVHSVQSGYASPAQIPGYVVGGKTGTAEVGSDQQPHAWFIGFAGKDQNNPQYVVAVLVQNGGEGVQAALPIGRDLLQAALQRQQP